MTIKIFYIKFICFFLIFLNIGLLETSAQTDPAELFDEFCADCHSIGEGDMKGPDLLGVERKHNDLWLLKFIRSAKTMISNGDKKAIDIWTKFEKQKMPNTKLSDLEIKSIIKYIGSLNKTKIEAVVSSKPKINKSKSSNGTNNEIDILIAKVNQYEVNIKNLEKKIDLILEYDKKSFSARITDEEINKGKELFEGKRSFTNKVPACVTCHNTFKIDTLNWNPSAVDVARVYSVGNNNDMTNIIINPVSDKMKSVLKNHKLTDDESFYLTAFLQNIVKTGLKEPREIPKNLIIFIVACLIMFSSIFDLIYTKYVKQRWVNITALLITAVFISNTLFVSAKNIGLSKNYSPMQPIKFSHKIHVKQNEIQCVFCHNSPEFSRESGIPSTNICMICHNKIKSGTMSGQFEINKIKKSFKNKKPIEWVKIHNLPDHVFFSHAQHVSVGKIDCKTCHGPIDEMNRTYQYSSLSMGWCIKCHREKEVQFENNKYYSNHTELHDDLKSGKITKITADKIGANDCQKCHY